MATPPKLTRSKRPLPQFVTKGDLAAALGVSHDALTRWIADGTFPPPWLRPGPGHVSLWRDDHVRTYLESRSWPEDAWGL